MVTWLVAALALPLQLAPEPPHVTLLVSTAADGGMSDGSSINSTVSNDGRFVAFESQASNLVIGDTNGNSDAFVRDRLLGVTTRISITTEGVQVTKGGRLPVISGDGTKAVFTSDSQLFGPDDLNQTSDVILRDLAMGTAVIVSVNPAGIPGDGGSGGADLSEDGRFVAFRSFASDLVPGDDNGQQDVFVRDMLLGTTERVSVATDGTQANGGSGDMCITADGRFVAFGSEATNLVADDTAVAQIDIFVHDRLLGTTELVSRAADGSTGSQDSFFPSLSADGSLVAFMSRSDNFAPSDLNGITDVFVKHRLTGEIELTSVDWQGGAPIEQSDSPDLSADGRFVVFGSLADNLIPPTGTADHKPDHEIFLRDRLLGTTVQISLTPAGLQPDVGSINPSITQDGAWICWDTYATNLDATILDTNASTDIALHRLWPWTDLGGGLAGTNGVPTLTGKGLLVPLTGGEIRLAGALPFALTLLVVSLQSTPLPFKGGVVVAFPFVAELPLVTDGAGELPLPFTWPADVPAGTGLWFQALLQDSRAVEGVAMSTTLAAITP